MVHQPSISFITGQLGLGGAEKQLYLLVRGLAQAGWRVSVITLNPGKGDYWERPIRELGIPLYEIRAGQSPFRRMFTIGAILHQEKPRIVHSWTIYANIYASLAGRLAGIPIRMGSERANHNSSRRDIGAWWYYWSIRGIDTLITNSDAATKYLREKQPQLVVQTVTNGVEIPDQLNTATRNGLRQQLGIPLSAMVIGAVGSLHPRKNFGMLIEAASLLAQQIPNMMIVLIGDGPLRKQLEQQVESSPLRNRCLFVGKLPNANAWFSVFDLFCLPSLDQEGMPNVLMEAGAAGLPVIATDLGGVSQIVEDNVTGFLIPLGDVDLFSEKIRQLGTNSELRRQMGLVGRAKMQREFSVQSMVARMLGVYSHLLESKYMRNILGD